MKELTLQEAALAWAQGKRVEAMDPSAKPELWMMVSEIGKDSRASYTAAVFNEDNGIYRFRLAPEPPAKRYRPWTPEDVPVGALIKKKGDVRPYRWMIVTVCPKGITTCGGNKCVSENESWFFETSEHSLDNGKTWLPCGVEVDA